jgi:hypothetical protein
MQKMMQEERLQRALARAQAEIKKKVGRVPEITLGRVPGSPNLCTPLRSFHRQHH